MKLRAALILAVVLAAAACGEPERRGGLSPEEERQLDNAARMLDDNMVFDTSGEPAATNGQ
jgi:hypothetical protein